MTTEEALPRAAPWIESAGRAAYRFRQHLQVVLLAAALLVVRPLRAPHLEGALLAASALLVLAGGALRSWAMGYHTWRRVRGEASRRTLVTAGPYAHTRNPLYLGSFLVGCGVAAMSGRLALLLGFAAVFVAAHYCIIRWEEGKLAAEFPRDFARYAAEVPRLFPGIRSAARREGRFDVRTMIRCMEPLKAFGFLLAVAAMAYMRWRGWTLAA